jgi:hypothetical protein
MSAEPRFANHELAPTPSDTLALPIVVFARPLLGTREVVHVARVRTGRILHAVLLAWVEMSARGGAILRDMTFSF